MVRDRIWIRCYIQEIGISLLALCVCVRERERGGHYFSVYVRLTS